MGTVTLASEGATIHFFFLLRPLIRPRVLTPLETSLCGHSKQGIQGSWNQTVATWLEMGFLGSLGPVEVPKPRFSTYPKQTSGQLEGQPLRVFAVS